MTRSNGIENGRKVYSTRITGSVNNPEIFALLQRLGTEKAARNLAKRSALENGQVRLNLLLSRICSILGIDNKGFTELLFIKRFREWTIPSLDKERNPDALDYAVRHLLEQVFDCALAYQTGEGLTIISKEERELIIQSKLTGFQLISPNLPQPVSIPFLSVTIPPGCERALVRFVPNQIAETKSAYPEQLRQRILFYLQEGHLRSAALLLFREQEARDVLAFLRKEKVANIIKADELKSILASSIEKEDPPTVEEMILGLLLRSVHPVISAHFIADLAGIKVKSAAKVLGIVGQVSQTVEVLEVGDLRTVENLSLAGFVLSTLLMQGNEKIANLLVAKGIDNEVYGEVFERVLNELHLHFDESVCKAEEYKNSKRDSLFYGGVSPFQKSTSQKEKTNGFWHKLAVGLGLISDEKTIKDKPVSSSKAMIKARQMTYGFGGEELFTPRLYFRNLASKLCEAKDYDTVWELMTCGRSAEEAFEDLNQILDSKSFALLLRSRDRKEVAEFVIEVIRKREDFREALAYALSELHENVKDIAEFFEYMIEKDLEIPGSRETAYSILYFGAFALEKEGYDSLVNRYSEILVQIEQDKKGEGWFDVDVFIKEGRFLTTDPPEKVRKKQADYYYKLAFNKNQSLENRIYALKMLARLSAWEWFIIESLGDYLWTGINTKRKSKKYDKFAMHLAKTYLDIVEELIPGSEQHRLASFYCNRFRDRLIDLFLAGGEEGYRILGEADKVERIENKRARTSQRARDARTREANYYISVSISAAEKIKDKDLRDAAYERIVSALKAIGYLEQTLRREKIKEIEANPTGVETWEPSISNPVSGDDAKNLIELAFKVKNLVKEHKYSEAFNSVRKIKGVKIKNENCLSDILYYIFFYMVRAGEFDEAEKLFFLHFGGMEGFPIHDWHLARFVDELINAMVKAGQIGKAIKTIKSLHDRFKASAAAVLVEAIHKYTSPETPNLSDLYGLVAWVNTRVYAILGM